MITVTRIGNGTDHDFSVLVTEHDSPVSSMVLTVHRALDTDDEWAITTPDGVAAPRVGLVHARSAAEVLEVIARTLNGPAPSNGNGHHHKDA